MEKENVKPSLFTYRLLIETKGMSNEIIGMEQVLETMKETGEIEKADLVLNKASQQLNMKPLFATFMMILDHYAKNGDVHNAEKIFYKMRQTGYVSRYRQYDSLLQAYINAKVPIYGLKADNMFPSKMLAERLAQVDAFKKTAVSDLLD
ncbi:hypothetical protein R6Q59_025637 [Mikania micrantha]